MPLTLKFSTKAKKDLAEIHAYLKRRDFSGANAVVRAIETSCRLLTTAPQSARETSKEGVRVKALPRYPYLIFYKLEGVSLYVIHVRHSARQDVTEADLGEG